MVGTQGTIAEIKETEPVLNVRSKLWISTHVIIMTIHDKKTVLVSMEKNLSLHFISAFNNHEFRIELKVAKKSDSL